MKSPSRTVSTRAAKKNKERNIKADKRREKTEIYRKNSNKNLTYGSHKAVVLLNVASGQYEPKGQASR